MVVIAWELGYVSVSGPESEHSGVGVIEIFTVFVTRSDIFFSLTEYS